MPVVALTELLGFVLRANTNGVGEFLVTFGPSPTVPYSRFKTVLRIFDPPRELLFGKESLRVFSHYQRPPPAKSQGPPDYPRLDLSASVCAETLRHFGSELCELRALPGHIRITVTR